MTAVLIVVIGFLLMGVLFITWGICVILDLDTAYEIFTKILFLYVVFYQLTLLGMVIARCLI